MVVVRVAIVVLLLSIASAGASAPAVAAQTATTTAPVGETGLVLRLVEVPTDRKDDPRANQYIVDHVEPGATIRRRIEVRNDTSSPLRAKLYVGGARVADGAFVPQDDPPGEVARWGSVTPDGAEVASGAALTATVELRVPDDAREGERYGAVWAELPAAAGAGGISTVNRVGIRIYLSVGPGGEPPTKFALPRFTATRDEGGRPGVDIEACNEGERAIDLSGELALTEGPGGVSAGPFTTSSPALALAPSQCATVPIRLSPELPEGPWKATVTLRSGTFTETATATITFPSEAGTEAAPVQAKPKEVTGTTGGRLALLLALLLLLLVLGLLLWWLWRRRKKKKEEEGDGEEALDGRSVG